MMVNKWLLIVASDGWEWLIAIVQTILASQ